MKTSWRSELAFSLFVLSMQVCWFGDSQCRQLQTEVACEVNLHDLRSAFLLREGLVNYDGRSAAEHQAELRRHFDAVLAIIEHNTPQAIEIALNRLEASQDKAWSPSERERHRKELLASRELLLERLRAYRDRGLFPQNESHADRAVPIFVDNHDTACAVGHLMRLAGWREEVADIQAANNLVYVSDAADSSVAKWALTAGITVEEAALIQPAYGWMGLPPIPDDAISITNPDMSVELGNLRYSNFRLYKPMDGDAPPVNIPVSHPYCGGLFCSIIGSTTEISEVHTNLRFVDTQPLENPSTVISEIDSIGRMPNLSFPSVLPDFVNSTRVVIQFEVEVISPLHRIAAIPRAVTYTGNSLLMSTNTLSLFVAKEMEQVSVRQVGNIDPDDFLIYSSNGVFFGSPIAPTKNMTIVTEILIRDGQTHNGQLMQFDVIAIPEPASAGLLAIALIRLAVRRCRSR